MFYKVCFSILCCVLLTSCTHKTQVQAPAPVASLGSALQHRQVAAFTGVDVRGVLDLSLHTGARHSQVILKGDPRDLAFVVTQVVRGVLHVTVGAGYPRFGHVQVEVRTTHLHALAYHGVGRVSGLNLNTRLLDVEIVNQGPVTLQGHIGLRKLELSGHGYTEITGISSPHLQLILSGKTVVRLVGEVHLATLDMKNEGRLSLFWVKSQELTIRGRGKAWIQLAGQAEKLNVELWGTARFNGRYLRADRAFVKTHDQSIAEMSAVLRQHTLALDKSDIHFYNVPAMKADFMAKDGAVLDMRNLASPFVQEYDEYNK
ncbi:MAG: DUF2807 domain-containing protein [Legionellales bacterium]|nr:DUF2807 domain-containing protein [Legionellales bacterium]